MSEKEGLKLKFAASYKMNSFSKYSLPVCLFILIAFNASDLFKWATSRNLTAAQGTLLVLSAVSTWGPNAVGRVIDNCLSKPHNEGYIWIHDLKCYRAISHSVGELALGLAVLSYSTAGYKRAHHVDSQNYHHNGVIYYPVDLSSVSIADGENKDMFPIYVNNTAVNINVTQITALNGEDVAITLGQPSHRDYPNSEMVPAHVFYAINGTIMVMDFLAPVSEYERTNHGWRAANRYYTTGSSMITECKYDSSIANANMWDMDAEDDLTNIGGFDFSDHYTSLGTSGYMSSASRPQCTYKFYDHFEDSGYLRV